MLSAVRIERLLCRKMFLKANLGNNTVILPANEMFV
jgi:hypothetical protein